MPKIDYKRLLIIAGFILAVLFIGFLLYYFFIRPIVTPTVAPTNVNVAPGGLPSAPGAPTNVNVAPGGLPSAPTPGVTAAPSELAAGGLTITSTLVDKPSSQITLTSDGNKVQYYNKEDGKFYYVDKNGKVSIYSNKAFYEVQNVTWSPDKEKAVLEYPDGSKIVYDFRNDKQYTLPTHWKDFSFSPTSDEFAAKSIGMDRENRWIITSSVDGQKATRIEPIGDKEADVHVAWSPNNQVVALYNEGKDFDRQDVYLIGQNGENFKSMVVEGRDFRPLWSENGDKLLYSIYRSENGYRPELWAVNAAGDSIGTNRTNLKIETWADKCDFFDNSTIYCAVPQAMQDGAGLFPDVLDATADAIYKIDLKTGYSSMVAIPDQDTTISQLTISKDGKTVYFTDKNTSQIKKIDLMK